MDSKLRACVAYITGRLISGRDFSSIYDGSRSIDVEIEGSIKPDYINLFDHDRQCYVAGQGNGNFYNLHDYGGQCFFELSIEGDTFHGYDYQTPCSFKGDVKGDTVCLYDDQFCQSFNFKI